MTLDKDRVLPIIKAALKEDIGKGDITTSALINNFASSKASIIVKDDCVVCGLVIAEWAMAQVDYSVRFKPNCKDSAFVGSGKEIIYLEGHTASILRAERTILNFLTFLSGIATSTKQFVDKAKPYGVKILDTRKTIPLLRYLEKYAVFTGGGTNHRMGLYDQALIKDNHIKAYSVERLPAASQLIRRQAGLPAASQLIRRQAGIAYSEKNRLKNLIEMARKKSLKGAVIEIEVTTIEEFNDALAGKPDIIMLDNMSSRDVKACVEIRRLSKAKPLLEVSGGISPETIEEYAKTRVDMISIGSLTASVKSIDMSLEVI
ncbi:MAG: nicotinate-nucleotide diphosphorylase [Candidatus Omnitrophota bacterium]|nr:nicotinate-nucleotide diphosphorylase [Candidatus Omnitrophota bacterium]